MKIFLLVALLSFSVFAEDSLREPQPQCINGKIQYQSIGLLFKDFCISEKGINTAEECIKYQQNVGPELTKKEVMAFLVKKSAKVCGG